ncbi:tRNA(Met) cytidine acetyltransferase TmcA [Litchfieldella xinjiangensis]|uniref:tRNA(Met) cytidine acetyltransferase TmcA n=1 Tax=Litchfieldella xinjiangensis TaxID=1166948 RepID=UPI000694A3F0|nr:GNAT family N-acetyltransferase [Halomonas xinjiangensis]
MREAEVAGGDALDRLRVWRDQLAARRWRGLVWLTGGADACRQRAEAIWHATSWASPLWVSSSSPMGGETMTWLPASKARTRLGSELDLVVIDAVGADDGFDPEAFGALSGTLRAGGLLVLMTPASWGEVPDADYRRLADYPYRLDQLSARYLKRLANLLSLRSDVARWPAGGAVVLPHLPGTVASTLPETEDPECATQDQAEAVSRLLRMRRRRPLVLTADRGRGKSAALGIACARWLGRGEPLIHITAPRPDAVAPLFARLAALCPQGRREGNEFIVEDATGTHRVRFWAPDALSGALETGEISARGALLLVDEAAAIPVPALIQWLRHFPRIAFATTVHGYEGSGRGFAVRFRVHLDRDTPDWRAFHLRTPVRFAADDPLERVTSQLLLLDAEPLAPENLPEPIAPRLESIDRATLAQDEGRLRNIFGLLVQAHYRTQPSDLRRLLDAPGLKLTSLDQARRTLAVAVTGDEGGFPARLADDVARGERRPQGHLLAQSLATHAGSREALTGRLRRVLRIAVHDAVRREGLGSRLLAEETERAASDSIDLLGASFGAERGLMAFWRRNGFIAVRLGLTRETSSGEHALMVVRGTSDHGRELALELQQRFQALLPSLLAFELKELDPHVAAALLAEGETETLEGPAQQAIDDVALGHRELALARPALQQLIRRGLASGAEIESEPVALLVGLLFQGRETAWLVRRAGVAGKRQLEARLRETIANWRQWV